MNDLHLKFKANTGTPATTEFAQRSFLTQEYLEYVEDLALKYLNQEKVNLEANRLTEKFEDIKLAFENLQITVGYIEEEEILSSETYFDLHSACDQLHDLIYDTIKSV